MQLRSVSDTASTVQGLIADDDPALEQRHAQQVAELYRDLPVEQAEEVTRAVIATMPPEDTPEFFAALAHGLSRDDGDDQRLAATLKGLSTLGDLREFHRAVDQWNTLPYRPAYHATLASLAVDTLQVTRSIDVRGAELSAIEYIDSQVSRGNFAGFASYFKNAPVTMSQPLFNEHAQIYGDTVLHITDGTHLDAEIVRLMGWDATKLTETELGLRASIHSAVVNAAGGEGAPLFLVPRLAATGESKSGALVRLPCFEVAHEGGTRLVTHEAATFDDMDAFLADPLRPKDMPVVFLKPGKIEVDLKGNVAVRIAHPVPGFLDNEKLQIAGLAAVGVGTVLAFPAVGVPAGVYLGLTARWGLSFGADERNLARLERGQNPLEMLDDPRVLYDFTVSLGAGITSTSKLFGLASMTRARIATATTALVVGVAGEAGAVAKLDRNSSVRDVVAVAVRALTIATSVVGIYKFTRSLRSLPSSAALPRSTPHPSNARTVGNTNGAAARASPALPSNDGTSSVRVAKPANDFELPARRRTNTGGNL